MTDDPTGSATKKYSLVAALRRMGPYRIVLWMMPLCILGSTSVIVGWAEGYFPGLGGWFQLGWFVINIAATYHLGKFDGHIRRQRDGRSFRPKDYAIGFVIIQLIIIPLSILVLAACVIGILSSI
jgi:hypothetical protein